MKQKSISKAWPEPVRTILAEEDAHSDYDPQSDVLYITVGGAFQIALSYEIAEGVLVRINPDSRCVVGITILDFRKRLEELGNFA